MDGETLSRFLDGELPHSEYREVEAHLASCVSCRLREGRFRLADGALTQALSAGAKPQTGRLVASLSLAAALVASLATNALLTPRGQVAPRAALQISAAPSETLTSFYLKVAPPQARP